MPKIALPLLFAGAAALASCSGEEVESVLCTGFCSNSTQIQRGYELDRDECRMLAELKLGTMPAESASGTGADKASKSRLVGIFSDCMNTKGWAVPGPPVDKKDTAPVTAGGAAGAAAGAPRQEPPPPASAKVLEAQRQRAADCAFARQSADSSIIAKKRAEACEAECRQQSRLAPEAPKPAACP